MKDTLWIQTICSNFRASAATVFFLFATLALCGCGQAMDPNVVYFDLPEGHAIETLQEASRQAGIEFIFSSELVSELKTPSIKGKYTPADVFNIMLADSSFVVVQHQRSGVYSVQKIPDK